jgi:hypothetical protein
VAQGFLVLLPIADLQEAPVTAGMAGDRPE